MAAHSYRPAICEQCDREFMARTDSRGRFCSWQCAGQARSGRANNKYNGGLSFASKAQRWSINCRDGTTLLYARGVMAGELGRLLRPNEIVHHIDLDTTNDDPANLVVMTRAEHVRLHMKSGEMQSIGKIIATRGQTRRYARKSHCKYGHPLSGKNLYVAPNGDRACRECGRQICRRSYYKRKAEMETQTPPPEPEPEPTPPEADPTAFDDPDNEDEPGEQEIADDQVLEGGDAAADDTDDQETDEQEESGDAAG